MITATNDGRPVQGPNYILLTGNKKNYVNLQKRSIWTLDICESISNKE
jgi:small-conductance mechanosensitive channel